MVRHHFSDGNIKARHSQIMRAADKKTAWRIFCATLFIEQIFYCVSTTSRLILDEGVSQKGPNHYTNILWTQGDNNLQE